MMWPQQKKKRTHIKRPIKLGTRIAAISPLEDESTPEPMQTDWALELIWPGGDMVVVDNAPVTTDSANDVKVLVGSVTVVRYVVVYVVRLPDSGGDNEVRGGDEEVDADWEADFEEPGSVPGGR
jgi:hypothetical protein